MMPLLEMNVVQAVYFGSMWESYQATMDLSDCPLNIMWRQESIATMPLLEMNVVQAV
jgi:hypothetical protein